MARDRTPAERLRHKLNRRMIRTATEFNLLEAGDRVMVCVSGGKDSYTLLDLLARARRRSPFPFEVIAVHLDQGQPGYDGAPLERWLAESGIPHEIVRADTYSVVLELTKPGGTFCAPCSRLRRGVLYDHAERLGCNKLALGHHRDDALETLLMNLFFAGKLQAMPAVYTTDDGRFQVIRPLIECGEAEIAAYAAEMAFPILPCNLCGSQSGLQRVAMTRLLDQLQGEIPNVREVMLAALKNVSPTHLLDARLAGLTPRALPEVTDDIEPAALPELFQIDEAPPMIDSIPHRVLRFAERQPEHPALHFRPGENWQTTTWRQYGDAVLDFAGALLALGYAPGQGVGILGNNRPEWIIADLGAMAARAVPAGIYQTLTAEQAAYIADHCEAKVVVVEDARQWEKLRQELDAGRLPKVEKVVLMTGAVDDPRTVPFFEFLSTGRDHRAAVEARLAELQDDDLATLIYTSGTTGPPKGVMLTHRNLAWTAQQANEAVGGFLSPADSVVSYLPLSHIAEQMFSIHLPATYGFPLWMTDRMESLKDTLLAGRPTLFLAVPRVWEKFKAALEGKLAEAKGPKAAIVRWARGVGAKAAPALVERGELSGLLAIQYRAANRLFFSKLAAGLGLDRLQCAVTGAAPIGRDVLDFFASCGVLIHEVYGQSEDAGPTTFNQVRPGQRRLGSAGKPLPGVDVRIAADGEICVRGPNVFAGYYKEPAATAETLIDGWLHSGDVGRFDEDGFLYITDRKKDLIITAGGKNVAPQNIEKRLKAIPGVGQAVVIGDRRKYLSALLTLDPEAAPRIAAEHGLPTDLHALAVHPGLHQLLQAGVDRANDGLARYEQVKRFAVLPIDFTVEGGELTPTQKVKRKVVNEKYAEQIAHLYDEPAS